MDSYHNHLEGGEEQLKKEKKSFPILFVFFFDFFLWFCGVNINTLYLFLRYLDILCTEIVEILYDR